MLLSSADALACDERVVGHITTPDDRPVVGAVVEIGDQHGVTADDGRYVVTGICAGEQTVHVHHAELMPWTGQALLPSDHLDIVLEPDLQVVVVQAEAHTARDPHASSTVEGAALERTRGQDLGEALEGVPGVTLLRTASDATRPMVRGFYGRRLSILRDGMRHESQKWGDGHAPEVDPFAAGSLTVVRGAAGVRYGPDALGGVVLLESPALRSEAGLGGRVDLIAGSNGAKGIVGGQLDASTGTGLSVRAQGNLADSAALSAPGYVLGNTASRTGNLAFTVGWNPGPFDLEAGYSHHDFLAGVCYCTRATTPDELRAILEAGAPLNAASWKADRDIDRPYQQVTHDQAYLRLSRYLGFGTLDLRFVSQLNRRREFREARASITGPQFDFTLLTHTLDAHFVPDRLDLGAATAEGSIGASASLQENVFEGLPLVPNHRAHSVGVYALERLSFGHTLFEAGARLDHQQRTTFLTPRPTVGTSAEAPSRTSPARWTTGPPAARTPGPPAPPRWGPSGTTRPSRWSCAWTSPPPAASPTATSST